jgi:hypothetical protein
MRRLNSLWTGIAREQLVQASEDFVAIDEQAPRAPLRCSLAITARD